MSGDSEGEIPDRTAGGAAQVVPPRVLTILKWFLTSVGISGLFIATGFLIDAAYQVRLGYDIGRSGEILHLTIEAARFYVDLVLISFTALADHPLVTGITAALGLLVMTGRGRRLKSQLGRKVSSQIPKAFFPWLLPALLLLEMGLFDVPMMGLQGMLIHGLTPPDYLHSRLLTRTLSEQVWQDEVCSRVSEGNRTSLDDLTIRCPLSKGLHQERLKDRFALNLFLTTILAGLAFGRIQGRRSESRAARNGATTAVLLAVLDLILLPYSYGKSMRSTYLSEVVMSHKPTQGAIHGFLLHRSPDAFVLFEKEELQIWVVPEDEVGLVRIESEYDVIDFFVNKKLESVNQLEKDSSFPP